MTKVRTLCIIGNGSSEEIHVEFLNTASLEPIDVIKKINKLQ